MNHEMLEALRNSTKDKESIGVFLKGSSEDIEMAAHEIHLGEKTLEGAIKDGSLIYIDVEEIAGIIFYDL